MAGSLSVSVGAGRQTKTRGTRRCTAGECLRGAYCLCKMYSKTKSTRDGSGSRSWKFCVGAACGGSGGDMPALVSARAFLLPRLSNAA